jgi:hypothetical protein
VNPILISNVKTQARKGLTLYNSANGITTLKKHVYVNHCMIEEKEVNNLLKKLMIDNLQRKDLV